MAVRLNKLVFLEHPRTGSTAIRTALRGRKYARHVLVPGNAFCVIRDPVEVVCSWWVAVHDKWGYGSIEEFILECNAPLFTRQGLLFYHVPYCQHVLRYEELPECLNNLLRAHGERSVVLPRVNVTTNKEMFDIRAPLWERFGSELEGLGYGLE